MHMFPLRLRFALVPAMLAAVATALLAAPAAATEARGTTLLTVTSESGEVLAELDLEALQEMPSQVYETTTVWTDGVQEFTGVPLADLIAEVAPDAQRISAKAINDYEIEMPRSGWEDGAPIVAYLNHGEEMSLRDKGPLWIIYPFDSDLAFRQEVIYARSIWQLDRITAFE